MLRKKSSLFITKTRYPSTWPRTRIARPISICTVPEREELTLENSRKVWPGSRAIRLLSPSSSPGLPFRNWGLVSLLESSGFIPSSSTKKSACTGRLFTVSYSSALRLARYRGSSST